MFIFFKRNLDNEFIFEKSLFWNMSSEEIDECKSVYEKTRKIISDGEIFKDYLLKKNGGFSLSKKGNKIKLNNFPKSSENDICHVRPHGNDADDTYPLPVKDKKLNVKEYSKQCFWLNNSFIRKIYKHS